MADLEAAERAREEIRDALALAQQNWASYGFQHDIEGGHDITGYGEVREGVAYVEASFRAACALGNKDVRLGGHM